MAENRVLSIQSHVVHGYCGNKSAVFPLQVLGFDVDAINSVQFSNHTQYETFHGTVMKSDELSAILEGLRSNNILPQYSHILTGYCGDPSFLKQIKSVVAELKLIRPDLVYVCDPVMGDYIDGKPKMYVPAELLQIYKDDILPVTDIILPNQYEAEQLTGITITDQATAIKAMDVLHDKGIKTVVITSTMMGSDSVTIMCLGSTIAKTTRQRYRVDCKYYPMTFTGTGDLFSALMLAHLSRSNNDLKESLEVTVSTMQAVLLRTFNAATEKIEGDMNSLPIHETCIARELQLVKSLSDIQSMPKTVKAVPLCVHGSGAHDNGVSN